MENEKKYSIDINELPSPKLFVGNLRSSRGFTWVFCNVVNTCRTVRGGTCHVKWLQPS